MSKSLTHIAVIGAGQFGSRHIQALKKMDRKVSISVIDPNFCSLELAKKRYDEMSPNLLIESINFSRKLDTLQDDLDVAIFATNSDVRKSVIENILSLVVVKYMILEKVAFQSITNFQSVIGLLESKNVLAWVNCPRRMYPFFKMLKVELATEDRIQLKVEGGNWNLASNTIHMLDLFAFLTGQTRLSINPTGLNVKVYKSKRKDLIELAGKLDVVNPRGDRMTLISKKNSTEQVTLTIKTKHHKYKLYLLDGKVYSSHHEGRWKVAEGSFKMPLQSELTHLTVQEDSR